VDGVGEEGELRVRVRAAAAEGQANEACLETLADALGVARSRLTLVRGYTARHKVIAVAGVDSASIEARWPGVKVGTG
jgi:uncharacterized protein YggU (UPF0235/DUF167 family)